MSLLNCEKNRVNKQINNPCETKQHIQDIAINNSWNIFVQILRDIRDGKIIFKENFLSRIP